MVLEEGDGPTSEGCVIDDAEAVGVVDLEEIRVQSGLDVGPPVVLAVADEGVVCEAEAGFDDVCVALVVLVDDCWACEVLVNVVSVTTC